MTPLTGCQAVTEYERAGRRGSYQVKSIISTPTTFPQVRAAAIFPGRRSLPPVEPAVYRRPAVVWQATGSDHASTVQHDCPKRAVATKGVSKMATPTPLSAQLRDHLSDLSRRVRAELGAEQWDLVVEIERATQLAERVDAARMEAAAMLTRGELSAWRQRQRRELEQFQNGD